MAWTLGGHRIYVEKDSGWIASPRVGEINVLDSSETIIHCAGRPSYTRNITFVVFSGYDVNIIPLADTCSVSGVLLTSDQGNEGYVYIKTLKPERLLDTSRITAVIRVNAELIQRGSDGS